MKRSASTCRLRKVACADCGYTVRMARSWMAVGLPVCPCGGQMRPDAPADMAWCGLIAQEDVSPVLWTAICRDNGWEDMISRKGAAAKAYDRRVLEAGGILARGRTKPHCVFPGCGRWVADGADRCAGGHAQHEHAELEAVMPF